MSRLQGLSGFSLKRLIRDLKELQEHPLKGIAICIKNPRNCKELLANIKLLDGNFKGVIVPITIHITGTYPMEPPTVRIQPRHPICQGYHNHIFSMGYICSDLLSNWYSYDYAKGEPVVSGWTPVYTLHSVLLLLQSFFSDNALQRSKKYYKSGPHPLIKEDEKFTVNHDVYVDGEHKAIQHTHKNPYPKIADEEESKQEDGASNKNTIGGLTDAEAQEQKENTEEEQKEQAKPVQEQKPTSNDSDYDEEYEIIGSAKNHSQNTNNIFEALQNRSQTNRQGTKTASSDYKVSFQQTKNEYSEISPPELTEDQIKFHIKNKLTCSVTKQSIYTGKKAIFGYPIYITRDVYQRLSSEPVIEIYSYEGLDQYKKSPNQATLHSLSKHYSSVFGQKFNHFLPIPINEQHYERSKKLIKQSIADIAVGDPKNAIFVPGMVNVVLPAILVKLTISFLKGSLHESESAIDAYCHYYGLYMRLIQQYSQLQADINRQVEQFVNDRFKRHKRIAGDLGEFMIKLSLSKYGIHDERARMALFEESIERQANWVVKENEELRKLGIKTKDFVKKFFMAAKISYTFFLIQFETAKLMANDDARAQRDEYFGLLNQNLMSKFRSNMQKIKKMVEAGDHEFIINGMGLQNKLYDHYTIRKLLATAFTNGLQKYQSFVIQFKFLAKKFAGRQLKPSKYCSVIPVEKSRPENRSRQSTSTDIPIVLSPQDQTAQTNAFKMAFDSIYAELHGGETASIDIQIPEIYDFALVTIADSIISFPNNSRINHNVVLTYINYALTYIILANQHAPYSHSKMIQYIEQSKKYTVSRDPMHLLCRYLACWDEVADKSSLGLTFFTSYTKNKLKQNTEVLLKLAGLQKGRFGAFEAEFREELKKILIQKKIFDFVRGDKIQKILQNNFGIIDEQYTKSLFRELYEIVNSASITCKDLAMAFELDEDQLNSELFNYDMLGVSYSTQKRDLYLTFRGNQLKKVINRNQQNNNSEDQIQKVFQEEYFTQAEPEKEKTVIDFIEENGVFIKGSKKKKKRQGKENLPEETTNSG